MFSSKIKIFNLWMCILFYKKNFNTTKTIYSIAINGNAYRYIAYKDLLQIEGGLTTNEPGTLAVKQAIEKAVFALIVEGILQDRWDVADPARRQGLIDR